MVLVEIFLWTLYFAQTGKWTQNLILFNLRQHLKDFLEVVKLWFLYTLKLWFLYTLKFLCSI